MVTWAKIPSQGTFSPSQKTDSTACTPPTGVPAPSASSTAQVEVVLHVLFPPTDTGEEDTGSMVAAGSFPYGRPGQAGCRLNYGRDEVVVSTSRGTTKTAIATTESTKQWDGSNKVDGRKYNRTYSDSRASNTLKPAHINQTDFRTTKGSTYIFDKTRSHAFYRGEVTLDWDHTIKPNGKEADAAVQRFDAKKKSGAPPADYKSPIELEKEFLETCRSRKKKGDNRFDLLVKMYGPEGAEAMTVIESMKRVPWRKRGKATAEDLAAVQELDNGDIALTPTPTQDFATTVTEDTSPTPLESDGGDEN